jgi:hypothetical protein
LIRFFQIPTGQLPAFSDVVLIDFGSTGRTVAEVTGLRVGDESGASQPLYVVRTSEAVDDFQQYSAKRFVLLLPRILSGVTYQRYANYDRFVVTVLFDDGTPGALVFAMGPDGRSLFDAALVEWRR